MNGIYVNWKAKVKWSTVQVMEILHKFVFNSDVDRIPDPALLLYFFDMQCYEKAC